MPEFDLLPDAVLGGVGELRLVGAHGSVDLVSLGVIWPAAAAKKASGVQIFCPLFFSSPRYDVL